MWEKKPTYGKYNKQRSKVREDAPMQREAPDMQFYAEIRDLNIEFLALVAEGRRCCHGPVFGLDEVRW